MDIAIEIWDNIKDNVQEKNRAIVLKEILLGLQDHGHITEDDLMHLKDEDRYFEEAIDMIYKDDGWEEEEDDEEEDW